MDYEILGTVVLDDDHQIRIERDQAGYTKIHNYYVNRIGGYNQAGSYKLKPDDLVECVLAAADYDVLDLHELERILPQMLTSYQRLRRAADEAAQQKIRALEAKLKSGHG